MVLENGTRHVERFYNNREALAAALAQSLAEDLRAALGARPAASLVVSGGSTPKPLFNALQEVELPWERVAVTLADERWVEPDESASNEGLVRRELLHGRASSARCVGMKTGAATPEEGQAECEERVAGMARPFDAVILGMGEDGHTASLFPEAPELARGLDLDTPNLCLAVRPPGAPHARISLTLAAILRSRRLILHITGESKRQVLEAALGEGAVEDMPIRAVLRGAPSVEIWWAP